MYSPILAPIVTLVAWSLVMQVWMYASRLPAMRRAGISLKGRVGSRGGSLEGAIPDQANWKAHNYNHLMEQPTIFYAIALSLALMDFGGGINLYLAWAMWACGSCTASSRRPSMSWPTASSSSRWRLYV